MRKAVLLTIAGFAAAGASLPPTAAAEQYVFACEPEWAALAREIGGRNIVAYAATHARQDAHHIRARPSLIARARRADLVFCSGAGLEAGWLPLLMRRGGRAEIQPGKPGHLLAAAHVPLLDKPATIDRSLGDIHPEGNPHVHLDPRNILRVADELTRRLATIDPAGAAFYGSRMESFAARWMDNIERWKKRGSALRSLPVIVHHKSWSYLVDWLAMSEVAALEPKPGIPHTVRHLQSLVALARQENAKAILLTPYDPTDAAEWLSEKTGVPVIVLPYTVSRDAGPGALAGLFDDTIRLLLDAHARR